MAVIESKCAILWTQLGRLRVRLFLHFCPTDATSRLSDLSRKALKRQNGRDELGGRL